jgi:hypothetical protein
MQLLLAIEKKLDRSILCSQASGLDNIQKEDEFEELNRLQNNSEWYMACITKGRNEKEYLTALKSILKMLHVWTKFIAEQTVADFVNIIEFAMSRPKGGSDKVTGDMTSVSQDRASEQSKIVNLNIKAIETFIAQRAANLPPNTIPQTDETYVPRPRQHPRSAEWNNMMDVQPKK